METVSLKRVLGFWALVAFGVGDILGAGIYALVGKVAGAAGSAAPAAFAVSLGVATLTAFSYAELGGRFPRSGGEASFCHEAFGLPGLSTFVGWLVLCSGVVSMATVSRAFAGYLQAFWPAVPAAAAILLFFLALWAINFRGMEESSRANLLCTAIEVAGLLGVIGASAWFLFGPAGNVSSPVQAPPAGWRGILQGGALAFFAFIGFEDMVNVAEEVKEPRKNIPRAILTALVLAGVLYMGIAFLAVRVLPPSELAVSGAPLLAVAQKAAPAVPAALFIAIALFAVSNTALLNFVMGSRLLYGMAQEGWMPAWLGKLHPRRRTPTRAILTILVVAVTLALSGTLVFLAGTTSTLILAVFAGVHAALIALKLRSKETPRGTFSVPLGVPVVGLLSCLALAVFLPAASLRGAAVLMTAGLGIAVWPRGRKHG